MAKRKRKSSRRRRRSGCLSSGVKANGTLRPGHRWAKGRKRCAIKARKSRK